MFVVCKNQNTPNGVPWLMMPLHGEFWDLWSISVIAPQWFLPAPGCVPNPCIGACVVMVPPITPPAPAPIVPPIDDAAAILGILVLPNIVLPAPAELTPGLLGTPPQLISPPLTPEVPLAGFPPLQSTLVLELSPPPVQSIPPLPLPPPVSRLASSENAAYLSPLLPAAGAAEFVVPPRLRFCRFVVVWLMDVAVDVAEVKAPKSFCCEKEAGVLPNG